MPLGEALQRRKEATALTLLSLGIALLTLSWQFSQPDRPTSQNALNLGGWGYTELASNTTAKITTAVQDTATKMVAKTQAAAGGTSCARS